MEAQKVSEVLKALSLVGRGEFQGIATDSRRIQPGDLFIALKGERFDGHSFLSEALQKGAAGLVAERWPDELELPEGRFALLVKDTGQALLDLAAEHRAQFDIPVIAVTGSLGKTTTKDLIAGVLATRFKVLKSQGNYNNEIGLPLTLLKLEPDHQAAVVEMGMRGKNQINRLAAAARPNIGVLTTITSTHYELLGSMANIAEAKAELLQSLPAGGLALINGENEWCRRVSIQSKAPVWFFGLEGSQHLKASRISPRPGQGTAFSVRWEGKTSRYFLPLLGLHNVRNALAAVGVGLYLGLTPAEIARGLEEVVLSGLRLEQVRGVNGAVLLNDTYNASPDSAMAALDVLMDLPGRRHGAVLGDMLELGDLSLKGHRQVGAYAAQKGLDFLITVGDLAASLAAAAEEAAKGRPAVSSFRDQQGAVDFLRRELKKGDTVLFKASRGVRLDQMVLELKEGT